MRLFSSQKDGSQPVRFDRAQRASITKFAPGWVDRFGHQLQYNETIHQCADHYIGEAVRLEEQVCRASADRGQLRLTPPYLLPRLDARPRHFSDE